MNENNIVSIDVLIDRIKICGYIDCHEHDDYYDEYEYDNILYYLEKYKDLQSKIDKAIEEIEYFELQAKHLDDNIYLDEALTNKLLDILKEEQPKETKELFEGTMDQLNDLSIFKEDK